MRLTGIKKAASLYGKAACINGLYYYIMVFAGAAATQ